MSDEKKGFGLSQVSGYTCEGAPVPEGFDPDAQGYRRAPAGEHRMRIHPDPDQTRFLQDTAANWEGNSYCLHQIWPRLQVVGGPHDGAELIDFIHVPTWDDASRSWRPMAAGQANKWANFCKAFGFALAPGQLWPPRVNGKPWTLDLLAGREAIVTVVPKLDRATKEVMLDRNGLPDTQVKLFGYRPIDNGSAGSAGNGHATHKPAPPAPSAPASTPPGLPPAQMAPALAGSVAHSFEL